MALGFQTLAGIAWGQILVPFQSNLPAGIYSDGAWADFNQDGYQDLALSYIQPGRMVGRRMNPDTTRTELYRYNPSLNRFDLHVGWNLGGLRLGWGDLDKNGWPDLLVTSANQVGTWFMNQGTAAGSIQYNTAVYLCRGYQDFRIADLNQSGWQDVVAIGTGDLPNAVVSMHQNDYFHYTEPMNLGLTPVTSSGRTALAVGDLDNDGLPDVVESGETSSPMGTQPLTRVCRGALTLPYNQLHYTAKADLAPVTSGSITLFDYDGDGDLDILVTGCTLGSTNGWSVGLYRNDGNFVFVAVGNTGLDAFGRSTADFADINLDGKPDLVLSGNTASGLKTRVYLNQGAGANPVFVETSPGSIPGVDWGTVRFGDFNHDARPDLLVTGSLASGLNTATVYRNALP
ncbi:MAG: Na-Ca exchanger/integrin-beta4 [Fibrobacteres bacterium]|nr:Na-Ca exchanger/integrin-beta4 [Fibrobacterota bacterium]